MLKNKNPYSLGYWLRQLRQRLELTRDDYLSTKRCIDRNPIKGWNTWWWEIEDRMGTLKYEGYDDGLSSDAKDAAMIGIPGNMNPLNELVNDEISLVLCRKST